MTDLKVRQGRSDNALREPDSHQDDDYEKQSER